jgi:outer membrane protein with beta-barrel domain
MKRWIAALLGAAALAGSPAVYAQESATGTPRVDVTIVPAGGTFFTEGKDTSGPSFGNYGLGAGVTVNINRYVGVEGELGGALGVTQDLIAAGRTSNLKSPNLINYSGNLVLSAPNRSSVVPYVTGGVGGLSLLETTSLGISGTETFLTGNVGAGLKWYAGRWGLRADYRFLAVRSKDDAPAFFGRETRYGHRVYGGLLLNIG